ncbi:MAG: thiol:disulfide interchange protein DsbA/DsbL [Ketobacteraceae bacterium]|nr:thiol:disulfide interchange protein DsbA/DsbL [Ketobacteraceae bacterium]
MRQWLVAVLLVVAVFPVQAVERFIAGSHYEVVGDVNAPKPEKPRVVEFFSYGCPHCQHLEPALVRWTESKGDAVEFERIPAQWNSYFALLARLYLTLEHLGVAEEASGKVFDYIHEKRKPLRKEDQIKSFAEKELGLDPEKFEAAWSSDEVANGMKEAGEALRQYRVSGVPALLVNDRYYVSVKLAGSEEMMFDVVDFLLLK